MLQREKHLHLICNVLGNGSNAGTNSMLWIVLCAQDGGKVDRKNTPKKCFGSGMLNFNKTQQ